MGQRRAAAGVVGDGGGCERAGFEPADRRPRRRPARRQPVSRSTVHSRRRARRSQRQADRWKGNRSSLHI